MVDARSMRGATPSPRSKLLAAVPHQVFAVPPPQIAMVPKQLDIWGNDRYGDCVSAEEAFAIAAYSTFCNTPERFVTEATVVAFARKYGFLNGAGLTEVMDKMMTIGMSDGVNLNKDGGYTSVDYSHETVLQSAISQGPVKIAIDANALPDGAGNHQGWYATGNGHFRSTDHCVSLAGYGPASWLYQQLGIAMPTALTGKTGYLLFTWSTIGFVDFAWIQGTCAEAWLRNPTTVGLSPAPTPIPFPPTPVPVPPDPTPAPTDFVVRITGLPSNLVVASTGVPASGRGVQINLAPAPPNPGF